jgi:hypothetical protein
MAADDSLMRRDMAGWLSTEENYRMTRRYWLEGRILGVTGDIGGASVAKLAAWLRQGPMKGKPPAVTFIYLANVGVSITGHETARYFSNLYHTLGQLPLDPQALTLVSQGTRVAYVRSYQRAAAHYDFLSPVGTDALMSLVEKPLAYRTLGSRDDAIRSLKEGLLGLVRDRQANGLTQADPSNYLALLDQLLQTPEEVKGLTLDEFGNWAKRKWPTLETRNDLFRAMTATLIELDFVQPPEKTRDIENSPARPGRPQLL